MNCLPLISRELRAGSRRWTTYWLRLLAAAAVIGGVLFWLELGSPSTRAGSQMFALMHRIVLGAIWVLVPLMTCDCLSEEKREGTLGLLFLTNLRASEIVLAKTIAHGLRALTLWLAVLPVIAIPLLMGGLEWREVLLSCSLTFASLCAAVAVGLLASALTRRVNSAVAWTVTLGAIGHVVFAFGAMSLIAFCVLIAGGTTMDQFLRIFSSDTISEAPRFLWNGNEGWRDIFRLAKVGKGVLIGAILLVALTFAALLFFSAQIIAPIIRRNWQDKPKTKRQADVDNILFKPVFWIGFFKRWMRRSLERNPIGWLEKRSWQGRTTAWVWLAVMISFATGLAHEAASNRRGDVEGLDVLMWLLIGTLALLAAGSFRRERETGALELILVTPLSERQIISGRLRGLWSQFLPSVAVWIAVVIYLSSSERDWHVGQFVFFAVQYVIVPVIGLYFSLRGRSMLLSWLATLFACFALPAFFQLLLRIMSVWLWDLLNFSLFEALPPRPVITASVQVIIASLLLWRLYVNLRQRSFSFR